MWRIAIALLAITITFCYAEVISVSPSVVSSRHHHQHHQQHKHLHQQHQHQQHQQITAYNNNKLRHRGNDYALLAAQTPEMAKFPRLKELHRRLEGLQKKTTTTTTTTPLPPTRGKNYYHKPVGYGWRDDLEVIDDYADEDEDEEDTKTRKPEASPHSRTAEEDTLAEDYYDDDEEEEDEEEVIVAERPPRRHDVQAEEGAREESAMTQFKWANYGTRDRVEESSRLHYRNNEHVLHASTAAVNHIMRMKGATRCRAPHARVVSVQSVHPSAGKAFRPHCTVLHRCGDDTGCCPEADRRRCRPKTQEIVHLYFYTTTFSPLRTKVEKLPFFNHTECACLPEDAIPEMKSSSATSLSATTTTTTTTTTTPVPIPQRVTRSRMHYHSNNLLYDAPSVNCKCPEEFEAMAMPFHHHRFHRHQQQPQPTCTCDCPAGSDAMSGCMNMKRGREHFSLKARKCIAEERCTPPACEYGVYMKGKGRCPRKQEKITREDDEDFDEEPQDDDDDDDDDTVETDD